MELGGQRHAPCALTPGKRPSTRPLGQCGQIHKNITPTGFDPRTVQPVAYTYYAIPAKVTLHAEYHV
jgi:hypothetical protein